MKEQLQGTLGWLTIIISLIAALTAFLRALLPWLKYKLPKRQAKTESPDAKPRIKLVPLAVGVLLLLASAALFDFIHPSKPAGERQTTAAFDYFNKGAPDPVAGRDMRADHLTRAISIANAVIDDLK